MNHPYTSQIPNGVTILRWQLSKLLKKKSTLINKPLIIEHHNHLPQSDYALWLAHASLLLELNKKRILIDPVFGNIPFYKRHTPLPIRTDQLKINLLLITHAHYDHFDIPSIKILIRNNPEITIVAPNGFWRYLKGMIDREKCFELEWWESLMVHDLFITLVPSQHWSRRTPFDTNKALWGGYVIQNQEHCIYHSGDTAMGEHFKEIGGKFEIDEAFLPIGAYRPEEIMKHNHTNPLEALEACTDLGAKTMIPIHYGTFKLSDEPLDEPLEWFNTLIKEQQWPFKAKVLRIGEVYRFSDTSTLRST